MKITNLTDEQRSRFGEFVEKWTAVGLCTDPADRTEAEAGICESYRIADNLAEPEKIV